MVVASLLLLLLFASAPADYAPAFRNSDDLDRFMVRLASRHGIALPRSFYSKPMHVSEILAFLDAVDSLDSAGRLTEQESFQLGAIRQVVSAQRSLFRFNREELRTENYVNLGLWGKVRPWYQEEAAAAAKGIINPKISGVTGNISYFSEVSVWTEYRSDTLFPQSNYEPYNGNPYNLTGDRVATSSIRSADLFRSGISYRSARIDLETAVDYIRQGPAQFFPLTFSGFGSPITYFRARMNLGAFTYVHTFGLLRTQKDKSKYLYTHRLDVPLIKNRLILGVNEVIINGSTAEKAQADSLRKDFYGIERDWEWVYMIPFVPYSFAEHYVGDRDNAVLSFDLCLLFPRNFRWYGEFLLDDIASPLTLFSDDFGNKWAFTLGAQYFGTLCARDLTVSLEYSRIEPWVYTHFYGGSHRYTHYGQSLGSPMGPNSDALIVMGEYAAGPRQSVGLFLRNTRKGVSRGSSEKDVFQFDGYSLLPADSQKKEFLGDNYTRITTFGLLWRLQPFGIFTVTARASYDSENRVQFDAEGGFIF